MKKVILFFAILSLQVQALALGNEIGNGGDSVAAQFISSGQFLKDNWHQLQLPSNFQIDAEKFGQMVKVAIVETRDSVDIEGRVVDAINFPLQQRIVVNRSRWIAMEPFDRLTVVFHEYLGLLTDADRNFEITPKALAELNSQVDVISRAASLLITTLNAPASPECPQLEGQWKVCSVGSEIPGLSVSNISIKQANDQGILKYSIDSNVSGVTAASVPGGPSNGKNTTSQCSGGIVNAVAKNSAGKALAEMEMVTLDEGNTLYIWLGIAEVDGTTIKCQK